MKLFRVKKFDGHSSLPIKNLSEDYFSDDTLVKPIVTLNPELNFGYLSLKNFVYKSPNGIYVSDKYEATFEYIYEASCRELILNTIQCESTRNKHDHILLFSDEEIYGDSGSCPEDIWEFLISDDFKVFVENLYFSILHMSKVGKNQSNFGCFLSRKESDQTLFVINTELHDNYNYNTCKDYQDFCCEFLLNISGPSAMSRFTEYSFFIFLVRDYLRPLIRHILSTDFNYKSVDTHDWVNFLDSFTKDHIVYDDDLYLALYTYGLLFDFPVIDDVYYINPNGPIMLTRYMLLNSFIKNAADHFGIDIPETLAYKSEIITAFYGF